MGVDFFYYLCEETNQKEPMISNPQLKFFVINAMQSVDSQLIGGGYSLSIDSFHSINSALCQGNPQILSPHREVVR